MRKSSVRRALVAGALALLPIAAGIGVDAQSASAISAPRHLLEDAPIERILMVKGSDGAAIVRVEAGQLHTVRVNDRLGSTRAVVTEVSGGRMVLDESFRGGDGRPNRALIIMEQGRRGGTRYLQRSDIRSAGRVQPSSRTPALPASTPPPTSQQKP